MTAPLNPERLMGLAERVEAASGPDRELDHAIHAAAFGNAGYCGDEGWLCGACSLPVHELTQEPGCGCPIGLSDERSSMPSDWRNDERLLHYTASLDAALSLVPEGYDLTIDRRQGYSEAAIYADWNLQATGQAKATTPALALTAAALRALAMKEGSAGS